jgi:hypothetical protein
MDLGAPVLDFQQDSAPIVSDGVVAAAGYSPVVITPTKTNSGDNYVAVINGGVSTGTKKDLTESTHQGTFTGDITIVE